MLVWSPSCINAVWTKKVEERNLPFRPFCHHTWRGFSVPLDVFMSSDLYGVYTRPKVVIAFTEVVISFSFMVSVNRYRSISVALKKWNFFWICKLLFTNLMTTFAWCKRGIRQTFFSHINCITYIVYIVLHCKYSVITINDLVQRLFGSTIICSYMWLSKWWLQLECYMIAKWGPIPCFNFLAGFQLKVISNGPLDLKFLNLVKL